MLGKQEHEFREPNLGFQALLTKWKAQDELVSSAKTNGGGLSDSVRIATAAAGSNRDSQARQESSSQKKRTHDDDDNDAISVDELKNEPKRHFMKNKNVYQQPLPSIKSFKPRVIPKNNIESELIYKALSKNFVFSDLSKEDLAPLVAAFEPCEFQEGDTIIKQGDPGDYFYVINSGLVIFQVNGKGVGKAKAGASFGELSLLYTVRRQCACLGFPASVRRRTECSQLSSRCTIL